MLRIFIRRTLILCAAIALVWGSLSLRLGNVAPDDIINEPMLGSVNSWHAVSEQELINQSATTLATNDIDDAKLYALQALEKNYTSGKAAYQLLEIYKKQGDIENGDKVAVLASELWPAHSKTRAGLADYWLGRDNLSRLLPEWSNILTRKPVTYKTIFPALQTLANSEKTFFLLFISVMHLVAGKLAVVPMSIIPIVICIGIFAQFPLARSINESMRESSQRQGLAVEAISGIESLKTNNAYSWVQKRWNHYTAKSALSSMKTKDLSNLVTSLSAMMQQLNTVVLVVYGTYLIHAENPEERITMGALIACVILSGRALAPVGQIAGLAVRFQSARLALHGVNEITERPVEYDIDRKYITLDEPKGNISFDKCSFAYDEGGKKALNQLSLNIRAGEKVAILGRIGSGKSTLLKLASALYEQNEGVISFDGVDIRQIDPYYLRSQVALLGQSPRLFLGTLRDNLDMASSDGYFSDDELLGALNRFGMAQLIQQHPKGLDMPIGEGGAGLSGGQQQIVALAQLTLKNPSVVLLDEPTSGLDQNSENMVLNALHAWLKKRTLILVTHRPQLLALVDRIVVVEQGQIVMDGPKQQVLAQLNGQPQGGQPQGQSPQGQPPQGQLPQEQSRHVQNRPPQKQSDDRQDGVTAAVGASAVNTPQSTEQVSAAQPQAQQPTAQQSIAQQLQAQQSPQRLAQQLQAQQDIAKRAQESARKLQARLAQARQAQTQQPTVQQSIAQQLQTQQSIAQQAQESARKLQERLAKARQVHAKIDKKSSDKDECPSNNDGEEVIEQTASYQLLRRSE